jgi:hypothetical protein
VLLVIGAQLGQNCLGQVGVTVFFALALPDEHLHVAGVDVGQFQVHDLAHAQAQAIAELEHRVVLGVGAHFKQLFDIARADGLGQGGGLFGAGNVDEHPLAVQHLLVHDQGYFGQSAHRFGVLLLNIVNPGYAATPPGT